MTSSLLDTRPGTGLDHVAELHVLIDQLHAVPAQVTGHARTVAEVDRAIHRLTAYKLKVLASAEKAHVAADAGFTDTNAWAARQTRSSRATAARDVALATDLETGHDTTAAALDEGLLSPAHAAVIVQASNQLPDGCSDGQRGEVEASLVEKAQRFDPDQLRRLARRAIEVIEPDEATVDAHENDLVATEEEVARSRSSLSLHDNGDGTTTGHFTVPTLAVAFLRKILDSMTAPRRMRERGEALDWNHRRGLAFAQLLEHLPTEHLHTRTAATVVVTIDHTVLTGALKTARLDTGETISAGEARRIACGAGILPRSSTDDPSPSTSAASPGSSPKPNESPSDSATTPAPPTAANDLRLVRAPPPTTLVHGGRTDLRDAVPLCHWHHQRIHDHAYHHTRLPDGSIRFTRQT